MTKPTIGQTVFTVNRSGELCEHEVTKVGRLYFYFGRYGRPVKVSLDGWWMCDSHMRGRVYVSKQGVENRREAHDLKRKVMLGTSYGGVELSLESLRAIWAIMEEDQ